MRISDWSSDVCSSDLILYPSRLREGGSMRARRIGLAVIVALLLVLGMQHAPDIRLSTSVPSGHDAVQVQAVVDLGTTAGALLRSEEHTSELQSLMRISYAVFCLKKKKYKRKPTHISRRQRTRRLKP